MLVGYNTNISYKGKVYHIQTEDSGKLNPVILTLLYSQGAILASKKTGYADIIADPEYKDTVRKIMMEQHKEMIKGLISGKFTGELQEKKEIKEKVAEEEKAPEIQATGAAAEPPTQTEENIVTKDQITKSLDDILLNYIMKRAK